MSRTTQKLGLATYEVNALVAGYMVSVTLFSSWFFHIRPHVYPERPVFLGFFGETHPISTPNDNRFIPFGSYRYILSTPLWNLLSKHSSPHSKFCFLPVQIGRAHV